MFGQISRSLFRVVDHPHEIARGGAKTHFLPPAHQVHENLRTDPALANDKTVTDGHLFDLKRGAAGDVQVSQRSENDLGTFFRRLIGPHVYPRIGFPLAVASRDFLE